ncbi:MAG: glycogen/starch/alpha-glucan phosphorylase [Geobacter sp.]|nr:glycogen/starch/alpha-glucan phosphorylase [Geobacter sp.]
MTNGPIDQVQEVVELDSQMLIIKSFLEHLEYSLGKDKYSATPSDILNSVAYSVRDRLIERWLDTQQKYYNEDMKRVYYLSMEFLLGKTLENSLINLGLHDQYKQALESLGYDLNDICEQEVEAGLGNGGLGRLAACLLDSMATHSLPAYGYGIRYEYGIFRQNIVDGGQVEVPDNWLRYRNPWEFDRQEHLHPVKFFGKVVTKYDKEGRTAYDWEDTEDIMAMAFDIPVPGYGNNTVNTLRLWSAKSTREFDLNFFNAGDYIRAVEDKMFTENISKVLYPADHVVEGKELRLKQEYFLASATIQDMLYRFKKGHTDINLLPDKVAIQLNDTHPALAIPELMRLLIDKEGLEWDRAWDICVKLFGYTNHTILPEAMEKWPVWMLEQLLPRLLSIIYEINERFLDEVNRRYPGDTGRIARMSIIEENGPRLIRMAHLAIVGSHSVNGVSKIHTEILKKRVFRHFYDMFPERFNNKTNGITQRRWLRLANPGLSELITSRIGSEWIPDLFELKKLIPLADDPEFVLQWQEVKQRNKLMLAEYIKENNYLEVNIDSMFDCQVKRIHEYKRQLLNVLHAITLYNRIKADPTARFVPRTLIFSGKAAPSYFMAKLIIRLINAVGDVINNDPDIGERLKVVFLTNYSVTLAEKIFRAADLSEQISTAGTEASGTGNMKFALNGALTIGTLDGANIEMLEEVGRDNIFIFGLNAEEVNELKTRGYSPLEHYYRNQELKQALDMIAGGVFSPREPGLFRPLVDSLLHQGDQYLLLTDYPSYIVCQEKVSELYLDQPSWTRKAILNTAGMGRFSSDRTVSDYSCDIWGTHAVDVCPIPEYRQKDDNIMAL